MLALALLGVVFEQPVALVLPLVDCVGRGFCLDRRGPGGESDLAALLHGPFRARCEDRGLALQSANTRGAAGGSVNPEDTRVVSSTVFLSTLLAVISLPLWMLLLSS